MKLFPARLIALSLLASIAYSSMSDSAAPVSAPDSPGYMNSYPGDYSTFQLEETRAQVSIGPGFLASSVEPADELSIALRYRISPSFWPASEDPPWHLGPLPLSLSIEGGALPPTGAGNLVARTMMPDANTTDNYWFKINYEAYLALIDELPHGHQNWVIPEIGAGVSLVRTTTQYDSINSGSFNNPVDPLNPIGYYGYTAYGTETKSTLAPYFSAGLHFFADRFVSLLLQASYIGLPSNNPFQIQLQGDQPAGAPPVPSPHASEASFPSSAWLLAAKLQIKLAWPTLVHTPLVPQMMPPWLMPAYTTAPISPWVSSTHPLGGNVMFQYQNRWADKVEIIGEFNDWTPEPMLKDRSGMWIIVEDLPTGKFRYNYIVNDKQEIVDPWNKLVDPDSRVNGSSVVVIH